MSPRTSRRYNGDYSAWFHVDPNGEVWCQHRDISCCPTCFARDRRFVEVGGVVYLIDDEPTLRHFADSNGDGITRMSPAYFHAKPKTHPQAKEPIPMTHIDNHQQYRQLLDALSVGDRLPDETYAAMVTFAKSKKIKTPPPNPEAKAPEPKRERTTNEGFECSEDGCDRPASALGLCKKHHTAHWRKDPANLEKSRQAARKHAAKKRYLALAAAIGGGFHPDTRGADYTSLPEGITPERVDKVVDEAIAYGLDVHGLALDVVNAS